MREIRARPYTGSVLIMHAPDVAVATLVEKARGLLALDRILAVGEHPPYDERNVPALSNLARTLAKTFREIDKDIRRVFEGEVELGTLSTLGFIGAGAAQVALGGKLQMPPWFNLAWWGFRTFMTAEQDEIAAVADAECLLAFDVLEPERELAVVQVKRPPVDVRQLAGQVAAAAEIGRALDAGGATDVLRGRRRSILATENERESIEGDRLHGCLLLREQPFAPEMPRRGNARLIHGDAL